MAGAPPLAAALAASPPHVGHNERPPRRHRGRALMTPPFVASLVLVVPTELATVTTRRGAIARPRALPGERRKIPAGPLPALTPSGNLPTLGGPPPVVERMLCRSL